MGGKQGSEGCTTWGGWEWNNTPLSAIIFEMMEQTVSVCCAWWAGLAIGTWVSVCVSVFGRGEGGLTRGRKRNPLGKMGMDTMSSCHQVMQQSVSYCVLFVAISVRWGVGGVESQGTEGIATLRQMRDTLSPLSIVIFHIMRQNVSGCVVRRA